MTISLSNAPRIFTLTAIVLVVAVLYFARELLIPFALALLLSFLLAPLVYWLQHRGLGRIPAVVAVVVLSFSLFGLLGWVVTDQLLDLINELPKYKENLLVKITSLRGPIGKGVQTTTNTIKELGKELSGQQGQQAQPGATKVEVVEPVPNPWKILQGTLGSLFKPLETAAIVSVLVIFMLLKRQDLRDRLIRLIGPGHLHVTTQALDDAACRIGRFLLAQTIMNGSFGLAVGIGLFVIGLPNAVLWGLLSAVLRFVPYVGTWIAATLPIILSLAIFANWTQPLLIIGWYILLELVTYNILEPWLYSSKTGVSSMAVIVAAVFWTWLWGSVGLILSTPLTVCLVVMGKYIPQLEFLGILLGDEPVLEPESRIYQRLLAMDLEEADEVVNEYLKEKSLLEACDAILIPVLNLQEQARREGKIDEDKRISILENLSQIIDETCDQYQAQMRIDTAAKGTKVMEEGTGGSHSAPFSVLCMPSRSQADAIAATLLARVLEMEEVHCHIAPVSSLDEIRDLVERLKPNCVFISAFPPSATMHARYAGKHLRTRFPDLTIVVGLWNGEADLERAQERLGSVGVDHIVTNFRQALEQIHRWGSRSTA